MLMFSAVTVAINAIAPWPISDILKAYFFNT